MNEELKTFIKLNAPHWFVSALLKYDWYVGSTVRTLFELGVAWGRREAALDRDHTK